MKEGQVETSPRVLALSTGRRRKSVDGEVGQEDQQCCFGAWDRTMPIHQIQEDLRQRVEFGMYPELVT